MSDIKWAVKDVKHRAKEICLAQEYYEGEHRPAFATEKWETAFGQIFRHFRDNLCKSVINAKADRMQIAGFDAGEDGVNQRIKDIWSANRMDRRAGEIHMQAFRDGDAFAIVWPNKAGKATFYPQRAERMAVRYSEEEPGLIEVAAKVWPADPWEDRSKWRLNLYYADRIERYQTQTALDGENPDLPDKEDAWARYSEVENEDDPTRGWFIKNEYGRVPVFVWSNDATTGEYGQSDLSDVIPLQDALNKTIADSLIAGEFAALPQRWATGLEVPTGPDGEPVERPFEAGVDRIWTNGNPNGRFGQFDPANMQQFVATADGYRSEIARVSRTPLHYLLLSGNFPSGEAQRAAEAPMMAIVKDRQVSWGNSWEDSISFALTIDGVKEAQVNSSWLDTTSVSESEKLDTMIKKEALGVPRGVIWKEMGYSDDEIKKFEAEAQARREQAAAAFAGGDPGSMIGASGMDASANAISNALGQ